jgi:hypothetical protein
MTIYMMWHSSLIRPDKFDNYTKSKLKKYLDSVLHTFTRSEHETRDIYLEYIPGDHSSTWRPFRVELSRVS